MKLIIYGCIFLMLFISCKGKNNNDNNQTKTSLTNDKTKSKIEIRDNWYFSNISEKPILEETSKTVEEIKKELSNTTISIIGNKININNYCQNIEYVVLKKKSLQYFTNKNLLERYSKELINKGLKIGDDVNVIRSVIPNEECKYPFGEILKIDDYLIVLYEGYLVYYSKEPIKKTSIKNEEPLIIEEGSIKTINLPFSFYNYFKDEYSDIKYPSYRPTDKLISFFKNKGYDAESYKCFIIYSDDNLLYLVTELQRGDSDYYILLTSDNSKIIDSKEIGSIGDENPITFKIYKDFTIHKYNGNIENNKPFEIYEVNNIGKIIKK